MWEKNSEVWASRDIEDKYVDPKAGKAGGGAGRLGLTHTL